MKCIIMILVLISAPLNASLPQGTHTSNKSMAQADSLSLHRRKELLKDLLKMEIESSRGNMNSVGNLMGYYQTFTLSIVFALLGLVMKGNSNRRAKIRIYLTAMGFTVLMYGLDTFQYDQARSSGTLVLHDIKTINQIDTMSVKRVSFEEGNDRYVKNSIHGKLCFLIDYEARPFQMIWYSIPFVVVGCSLIVAFRKKD
jgi:hypothetical protein